MFKEPDVGRLKRRLTHRQFVEWVAYLELKQEERSKLDHYIVAVRHDLHLLIQLVRNAFGNTNARPPSADDLFLTGKSADRFVAPEGYEFDPDDPVRGNHEKGYGLPGIEVGQPLNEKWQKINDAEKQKWQSWAKMTGMIRYRPATEEATPNG